MLATSSQNEGTATTTSAGPKGSRANNYNALVFGRHSLAQHVLAGDAAIDGAVAQRPRDLECRNEANLDVVHALKAAAIPAIGPGRGQRPVGRISRVSK